MPNLIDIKKVVPIYCEVCKEDLTKTGAFITYEGKIYCVRGNWCLEKVLAIKGLENIEGDFFNSRDIQSAIRTGTFQVPKKDSE
jgi:hypothetical protein